MKRHQFVFATLLSCPLLLAALWGVRAVAHNEVVNWRGDFEQARAEARRTGKPLFVVFR
ncbi:MAG: thioredoxin family protein [Abditibacteriales bacterium]|nr:thioredoxin family protein [Abditibacteriales bacterium]MDW8366887.1 hypothetical protein [Abditibacteriales bacterium]